MSGAPKPSLTCAKPCDAAARATPFLTLTQDEISTYGRYGRSLHGVRLQYGTAGHTHATV